MNYTQPNLPVTKQNDSIVYEYVDEEPEFPGGKEAYAKYLATHIIYPKEFARGDVMGTIYISVIITKVGKVKSAKILNNKVGEYLGAEALRVVNAMPDWKPAKMNGRAVNVRWTIPVKFDLKR